MSASQKDGDAGAPVMWFGLSQSAWVQIGVIAALFGFLFWPNLRRLWDKTNPFYGEANWGHAIGIPVIGLYYLYVNREKLLHPDPDRGGSSRIAAFQLWFMAMLAILLPLPLIQQIDPSLLGLKSGMGLSVETFLSAPMMRLEAALGIVAVLLMFAALRLPSSHLIRSASDHSAGWFGGYIVVFGILLFAYGIYPGQNDFVKDFGMVVTLFGVVTALVGWPVMRIAWFPVVFLVCGIPWPGLVYSKIAGPLQQLAAHVAVWTLQLTGVQAEAGGTKIMIEGFHGAPRTLNVAEACAGLRSLMTFISVAAAVAFLSSRDLWQKILIVLSAIPIAIFCNVMRVSGQGLLDHYVSQQLSENFAHQFVGLIMMIPAFLLILLVAWMLDQIFLEQVDRTRIAPPKIISRTVPQPPVMGVQRNAPSAAAPFVAASAPAPAPAVKRTGSPVPSVKAAPTATSATSPTTPVAKPVQRPVNALGKSVAAGPPAAAMPTAKTPSPVVQKLAPAPVKNPAPSAKPAPAPRPVAPTPVAPTPRPASPPPPPSVRLAPRPRTAPPTPRLVPPKPPAARPDSSNSGPGGQ